MQTSVGATNGHAGAVLRMPASLPHTRSLEPPRQGACVYPVRTGMTPTTDVIAQPSESSMVRSDRALRQALLLSRAGEHAGDASWAIASAWKEKRDRRAVDRSERVERRSDRSGNGQDERARFVDLEHFRCVPAALLRFAHCESDGVPAPSSRDLRPANVVPMHRVYSVEPSGASAGRRARRSGERGFRRSLVVPAALEARYA